MLKIAHNKIDKLNINNINLKTCEAENLVFDDNQFDIISIGYGVRKNNVSLIGLSARYISYRVLSKLIMEKRYQSPGKFNLTKGLSESYRVLKNNGKLIILETSIPENPIIKLLYKLITTIYIPVIAFIFSRKTKAYSNLYLLFPILRKSFHHHYQCLQKV